MNSSKERATSSTTHTISQNNIQSNGKKELARTPLKYNRNDNSTGGMYSLKIKDKDGHKARQFDILQQTNPMQDDYHTGIRSVGDIHTAEEVFTEDEFMGAPDWTFDDAQNVLAKGGIMVYSSYPIADGVFVTPSKMMAKDYAAEGKVYRQRRQIFHSRQEKQSEVMNSKDLCFCNSNIHYAATIFFLTFIYL